MEGMYKKNKVLVITSFYPPAKGGIQTYSKQVVERLQKLNFDVTTLVVCSNGITDFTSFRHFKVFRNGKKSSIFRLFSGFDSVFTTSWFPGLLIAIFLSKFKKSKLVVTTHGNELLYPEKHLFLNLFFKKSFEIVDRIIAVSNFTKSLVLKQGVDEKKITIIPNGTDPIKFNPDTKYNDIIKKHDLKNKKIIFSVSRLVKRKNFDKIIMLMPEILKEIPNAMYVIGGKGPEMQEWIKLSQEISVNENVLFTGFISDDELPKYYAMCNVFVLASKQIEDEVEGYGIAFLEANACGKPVVGGKSGGIADAIIDGKTGLLVDPYNNKEIKEAIIKILKDEKYANNLGKNGRRRIEEDLSWEKVVKRISKEL